MLASRPSTIPRGRAAAVAVALLAFTLAGCSRESDQNTADGGDTGAGQVAIEVELTDEAIEMPAEISAGSVEFEVTNSGTLEHGFTIDGTDASIDTLAPDQRDTVTVELQPGTHTAFSPVDGDRNDGLEWSFTVTDEPDASGAPLFEEGVEPGENGVAPSESQPGDGS
jgi:hypothetical protein